MKTIVPYTHIESYTGLVFSGNYYPVWVEISRPPNYGSRTKPQGLDRLFKPTTWYYSRLERIDGFDTVTRVFTTQHPYTGEIEHHTAEVVLAKEARCGLADAPSIPGVDVFDPTAILLKIKEQGVNLGVTLAEYRQTGDMFVKLAASLVRTYRDVRKVATSPSRARLKRLKRLFSGDPERFAKKAPDNWLMYRYGVTPLISDVEGSINAMIKASTSTPLVRRYSCRVPISNLNRSNPIVDCWYQYIGEQFHYGERYARLVAHVEWLPNRQAVDFWDVSGLGNPLATAWELIPFSFVLDWAIGVGDYLTSLDALDGSKRVAITSSNILTARSVGPQGQANYDLYNRYVLDATPPLPSWKPSLTWKRCIDSVALLRSIR